LNDRTQRSYEQLCKALTRLDEAARSESDLALDATIQRFEFVFELSWKTLRYILLDDGITTNTPRATLKAAFQAGLIDDEAAWVDLLEARNLTSHTYDEELAARVYQLVVEALPVIRKSIGRLETA
jgi:nucleotidyltransferase substrate binding protein (TIGR01987 family)